MIRKIGTHSFKYSVWGKGEDLSLREQRTHVRLVGISFREQEEEKGLTYS